MLRPDLFDDTPAVESLIPRLDWCTAFTRPPVEAVVDGLLIPGRWTSFVAPAKTGKSSLTLHLAHTLARGLDPFTGHQRPRLQVAYFDGEMGEIDVTERLEALDLTPADLDALHYFDRELPKGDTVEGGARLVSTALAHRAEVVVIDGVNAFLSGAEKDDIHWRELFTNTIAPLKRSGVAVMSSHNMGVDTTRGRGSTVQADKPDAVVRLKRTDTGVKLTCDAPRTVALLRGDLHLEVRGLSGECPITYRETATAWPAGTAEVADLLDALGVPTSAGRPTAQAALKDAGRKGFRVEVLSAAIKYRKSGFRPGTASGTGAEQAHGNSDGNTHA